ncbi:MAG: hypothetical protein HY361_02770 [Candidatus Aenigmarchaeota archaeon]|nr:hypothetical protein [Candidatus Aenigmarchaeota archaeon]
MKGQSLVVQFLLFFIIGLGLFIAIGGAFRLQADIIREDVAEANRELIASYISSIAVSLTNTCKECDYINYTIKLKELNANYIQRLRLADYGLQIFSTPSGGNISDTIHLLNNTIDLCGNAASPYPITLIFNKTQNIIKIGNIDVTSIERLCPSNFILFMKDSIQFTEIGDAILKGALAKLNPDPQTTPDDEFVFKDSAGNIVVVINLITGNMVIKGDLFENQASLTPSAASNDFIIKNSNGDIVSFIDESGNFYLKGMLIQNAIELE